MIYGVLDRWESTDNALVVRDLLVRVERNVEVDLVMDQQTSEERSHGTYPNEDSLVLEINVSDSKSVRERHDVDMSCACSVDPRVMESAFGNSRDRSR